MDLVPLFLPYYIEIQCSFILCAHNRPYLNICQEHMLKFLTFLYLEMVCNLTVNCLLYVSFYHLHIGMWNHRYK